MRTVYYGLFGYIEIVEVTIIFTTSYSIVENKSETDIFSALPLGQYPIAVGYIRIELISLV